MSFSWLESLTTGRINLYDLVHYPHVGQNGDSLFDGPPIIFVLLNFLLFIWIFHHYLWPLIAAEVARRHHETSDLLKAAERMERDARAGYEKALERSARLEFERSHIKRTIEGESLQDVASIEAETEEYVAARRSETLVQINLKMEAVDQKLREEMILAVVKGAQGILPDMITPSERTRLISDALNKSREKEAG